MLQYILYFLVLINPFALFLYLAPLKRELGYDTFKSVVFRASLISFAIYLTFALTGEALFSLLQLNFESFRIFGGLVITIIALIFIVQGKKSMITTKGELSMIAAEVALPFIVGVGTITLSIIIGNNNSALNSALIIGIVLLINYMVVLSLAKFRHSLPGKFKIVFDKNAEILLRINSFIVGAFGIDLIVTGISNLLS